MPNYYKLTDTNMRTYNDMQWTLGEWREASGTGPLCNDGWLHGYHDPLLAVFLNPIHADFETPRLWRIEIDGRLLDDRGLKFGAQRVRLVEELPLPQVSTEQRIRFAILCGLEAHADPTWRAWAADWLAGRDRTARAERAEAERAAWAERAEAERAAEAAAAAEAEAEAGNADLIACAHEAVL